MNQRSSIKAGVLSQTLTWMLLLPLHIYRLTISRVMPDVCRFRPTCSEYMLDSLQMHGPIKGLALGIWRVLRCQPFAKAGWDPVPPRRAKKN